MGHAARLRRAAEPDGLARPSSSARTSCAATRPAWSSATTSSTATACRSVFARASARASGATVFAYRVDDPERYGVVDFDADGRATQHRGEADAAEIELGGDRALLLRRERRRARQGRSNLGPRRTRDHRPQPALPRGGSLHVELLGPRLRLARRRHAQLAARGGRVRRVLQTRQGQLIASPEEIAFSSGWIDAGRLISGGQQDQQRVRPGAR